MCFYTLYHLRFCYWLHYIANFNLLFTEVEAIREEMEGIKIKGKGCPKPIKNWAQCGVSKKVMEVLKK